MGFSHGNSKTNILPKRNNTKRYYLIITFVCFGFSKILFAQEVKTEPSINKEKPTDQPKIDISAAQLPKSKANSVFTLGAVDVMSAPSGVLKTNNILTSVDVLGKNLIQNQNVNFVWELFGRVPGVQLTNFNQGNVSGEFSFRGFNGEGNINGIKLLIDGIPSNTHDGNMGFIDSVFPQNIESIEVVRGTNDPRYGLYNIAGNASITTTTGGNYARGRVSYGSFNTTDIQTSVGYEKSTVLLALYLSTPFSCLLLESCTISI